MARSRVIAGHFLSSDESPVQLDFVHAYLTAYKQAASAGETSTAIVAAMSTQSSDLPGRKTLQFGAKAFSGEVIFP